MSVNVKEKSYKHIYQAPLPEKLQVGRRLVQTAYPYFSSLNWSVIPVEVPGLGTMASDRYLRLYFDRATIDNDWSIPKIIVVLVHEYEHIILKHHRRINDNVATDLSVNSIVDDGIAPANHLLKEQHIKIKLEQPTDWLHPTNFGFDKGLLPEEYYDLLKKLRDNPKATGCGKSAGKDKDNNDPNTADGVGRGSCGSCASDKPAPWELPGPDDNGPDGLSESELDIITRQVAQDIIEHEKKKIGSMPGGLLRWAKKTLSPPKVPWEQKFRGAFRHAYQWAMGVVDYSWTKISRRSTDELLLPGLRAPVPSVAVVVDTSGSMSTDNGNRALSELTGIIRACGLQKVPVLVGDAAFQREQKVSSVLQLQLVGGGGTDMSLGITEAANLKPRPRIIVVLTDGCTGWPAIAPRGIKVIALLVQKGAPRPPDWITTIEIDD